MSDELDYQAMYGALVERQKDLSKLLDKDFALLDYIRQRSKLLSKVTENAGELTLAEQTELYAKYADCIHTAETLNKKYHFTGNTEDGQ